MVIHIVTYSLQPQFKIKTVEIGISLSPMLLAHDYPECVFLSFSYSYSYNI